MPTITNLTGSVWEFKPTLDLSNLTESITFVINFINNGNSYSSIELHPSQPESLQDWMGYDLTHIYNSEDNPKWINNIYKTITIINGDDVTNDILIGWLQQNATVRSYSKNILLHPYDQGVEDLTTVLLPQVLSDDSKQDIFQYNIMPEATSDLVGKIIQYIGISTSDYICGYFYICISSGSSYSWEFIPTQPFSSGHGISNNEIIEEKYDIHYAAEKDVLNPTPSQSPETYPDFVQYDDNLYLKTGLVGLSVSQWTLSAEPDISDTDPITHIREFNVRIINNSDSSYYDKLIIKSEGADKGIYYDDIKVYNGNTKLWTGSYQDILIGGGDYTNYSLYLWLDKNGEYVSGGISLSYQYRELSIGDHPFATTADINALCGKYSITGEIENGGMSGDAFIWSGERASVTITPDPDHDLPSSSSVTITNATGDFTNWNNGVIELSNPTGNVTIGVTCESSGYNVTITFQNGASTSYWDSTRIYSNYELTLNSYPAITRIDLLSSNQIGSITSVNGSTTVTTTTGKIFIYGKSTDYTEITGTITTSSGITNTGSFSSLMYGSIDGYACAINNADGIGIDASYDNGGKCLLYTFTVTANGTITIDGADWRD